MTTSPFKHILVGVDFSRASEEAFAVALRLARRDHARVTVVHIAHDMAPEEGWTVPWSGLDTDRDKLIEVLKKELGGLVQEFPSGDIQVEHHVALGVPSERLASVAVDLGADLIVVASVGKGVMQRILIGSTTEALVRRATVPVWIARPGYTRRMSRVVVGVDYSNDIDRVLATAVHQAERDCADLDVVHVYRDPGEERAFAVSSPAEQHEFRVKVLERERRRFDEFCAENLPTTLGHGAEPQRRLLAGKPSKTLLLHAEEVHADLIVLGRHSHGLLHDLFVGSTAERLLRHSPTSVLVTP